MEPTMLVNEITKLVQMAVYATEKGQHRLATLLGSAAREIMEDALAGNKNLERLTQDEIDAGIIRGRIACIKAYRTRTGASLVQAIAVADGEFARKGLEYYRR